MTPESLQASFLFFLSLRYYLTLYPSWPGSYCLAQADPKLTVSLLRLLTIGDYMHTPSDWGDCEEFAVLCSGVIDVSTL